MCFDCIVLHTDFPPCYIVEIAISPNSNEVQIYKNEGGKWIRSQILSKHDLRVTSLDWAPSSNRIVSCGAVSIIINSMFN